MDKEEYLSIEAGLRASYRRYPNCRVASCDCDEKGKEEWISGCACPGHFTQMDAEFGEMNWKLRDFNKKKETGIDGLN